MHAIPRVHDGKMDRLWRRGGIPDPLIWLAFVASATSSIKLGTNVMIVPEHQPVVLAKSAATLDALSGGRVVLGIGVGELPEEYGAVGMDFTNRGQPDGRVPSRRCGAVAGGGRDLSRPARRRSTRSGATPARAEARCRCTSAGRHRRPSGGRPLGDGYFP